jgi:hypothetical protein
MSARYDSELEGFNEFKIAHSVHPRHSLSYLAGLSDMTPNLRDLTNCRRPFGSSSLFVVIFGRLTRYDNECEGFNELSVPIRFILPIRCHIWSANPI